MTTTPRHLVILGAGTGGTIMANRLASLYSGELDRGEIAVTIVDQDDVHVYQPGLLFLPFGVYDPEDIVRPRQRQLSPKVTYLQAPIDRVDAEHDTVVLEDGRSLSYDVLIVATGSRIAPEETEGLTGPGWREKMFDFYTLDGALALRDKLASWEGGRLVINFVDLPIKCPVAPIEFAFLADWFFTEREIRDRVSISYVTPLDSAFTRPIAATRLAKLMAEKGIERITEFATGRVDGAAGKLVSWDEREVDFDLLVTIPLHNGAAFVSRSPGLGDDLGFVKTDQRTLQAEVKPNVFALGDATNVPASKAGSVVHFEAEVLTDNVRRFLAGEPLEPDFDGHSNCFIETGFHKAMLIDFNYDTEPLPGTFPLPKVGPMRLLEQTRLNHLGKMAFKWVYWNVLLPGHDIPGVKPQMTMRGKERPVQPAETAAV